MNDPDSKFAGEYKTIYSNVCKASHQSQAIPFISTLDTYNNPNPNNNSKVMKYNDRLNLLVQNYKFSLKKLLFEK